ncbi:MAG TPA: hypothetical protein VFG50_09070 [Rhodothermales bacterium]|nr:hypothetical protein [Rhodothermales bacterium]
MYRLLLLFAFCIPATAFAQDSLSYVDVQRYYPGAIETTVTAPSAFIYRAPSLEAPFVGRYNQGKQLLAYRREGDFYAVASPEGGAVGYMLLTVLDVPQVPGAAQPPQIRHGYVSPSTATIMSIAIPGSGQIYAGDAVKGGAILGVAGGSLLLGLWRLEQSSTTVCDTNQVNCKVEKDYSTLAIAGAVAGVAWIYGAVTAANSARQANERKGFTTEASLVPLIYNGETHLGLAFRARW